MTQKLLHRCVARLTLLLLLFTVILIGMVPLPLSGWVEGLSPLFPSLIFIFYFSIFLPDAIPFWAVFLVGLLEDAIIGHPMGVTASVYLFFHLLLITQQRFFIRKPYNVLLVGFIVSSFVVDMLEYALLVLLFHLHVDLRSLLFGWAMTASLYSLCHWPLTVLHKRLNGYHYGL